MAEARRAESLGRGLGVIIIIITVIIIINLHLPPPAPPPHSYIVLMCQAGFQDFITINSFGPPLISMRSVLLGFHIRLLGKLRLTEVQ